MLPNYFLKHNQVHNYPTRNCQDYRIHKTKKMFPDRAIQTVDPALWNSQDSKKYKDC